MSPLIAQLRQNINSILFGFGFWPTLENFHLGKIINTHSCCELIQLSLSLSSSTSTVIITSVPYSIRVGQVIMIEFNIWFPNIALYRYLVPQNQITEVHYQGKDFHCHWAIFHLNFGMHKVEAIIIKFCYRAFHRIMNGPTHQYIYRKITFDSAPWNIIFYPFNKDHWQQWNEISII
jgi:hypothetical protein